MNNTILLVEDDILFGETVKDYFTNNGLPVIWAQDGSSAIYFFQHAAPQLVLLDVQLPDYSGFEIAAKIREINSFVPLVFMTGTALENEDFSNAYLNYYAKNYLEKPIKLPVALALVKSILSQPSVKVYKTNKVNISIGSQLLVINDQKFYLRDKDTEILFILLDSLGFTVTRKTILLKVWGGDDLYLESTLNTCISRIKKTLKNSPLQLKTIYGTGYMLKLK